MNEYWEWERLLFWAEDVVYFIVLLYYLDSYLNQLYILLYLTNMKNIDLWFNIVMGGMLMQLGFSVLSSNIWFILGLFYLLIYFIYYLGLFVYISFIFLFMFI